MPRSVPLSVRVSDEDAAFLARYEAPDAKTPSEKVRAILTSARRQFEGQNDFAGCAEVMEDMLRPGLHRLREAQREAGMRSDFVMKLYERLPELVAELVVSVPEPEAGREGLERFESSLADPVFAMIEEIVDLGLTNRSRSFDSTLVRERLAPILELLKLIDQSRQDAKGSDQ